MREASLNLAAEMIYQAGKGDSRESAFLLASSLLNSGQALASFRDLLVAQGGDTGIINNFSLLRKSYLEFILTAPADGYIYTMDAETVGLAAMALGAGRRVKDEEIDHGAGIILLHKVGDQVTKGQKVALLYAENTEMCLTGKSLLAKAITIKKEKPSPPQLISRIITNEGIKFQ